MEVARRASSHLFSRIFLRDEHGLLLQENMKVKQLLEKIDKPEENKLISSDKKCETSSSVVRTVTEDFYLENASVTGISGASIKDEAD